MLYFDDILSFVPNGNFASKIKIFLSNYFHMKYFGKTNIILRLK